MTAVRVGLVTAAAIVFQALDAGADDVTLSTSRPCYAPGETVAFVLANSLESTIFMPHSPVWDVFETATGSQVAPAFVYDTIVALDGHGSATDTWNQRDYDGNAVNAGEYRVEVRYSASWRPWVLTTIVATFEISGSCPTTAVDRMQWGRFKGLFR